MKQKLKIGLAGTLLIAVMTGTTMALTSNTIDDIKGINRELTKIEIDVYESSQKKAIRENEIKRLSAELDLINNHIDMREKESERLVEQKKLLMSGDVFITPQNKRMM